MTARTGNKSLDLDKIEKTKITTLKSNKKWKTGRGLEPYKKQVLVWWSIPATTAMKKPRQVAYFKASLGYIARPVRKNGKKEKKGEMWRKEEGEKKEKAKNKN